MSNKSLVSLTTWAKQTYNDAAPCLNTLRKWAREALIQPPPQRHGRAYFVDPDARSVVALAEQIEIFMPLPAAPGGFNRPLQHKAAVPK
ncbi:excisionase [Comamonas testosteroni]|uniref:excisionase n=1 Tax=Comamonas testosteroni TaxID=285 RepID=UPI003D0D6F42